MRELVLTGHKDAWPDDEKNAVFLGPWCFSYNHKFNFLDQERFQLAPSPWKKAQDILDASMYVDALCDRIMPKLAGTMNEFHGVSYSERFWNAYTRPWLTHWVGIAYEHFRRLEHAGKALNERFTVKVVKEEDPAVKHYWDLLERVPGHHYHLMLMSDIIDHAKLDYLECREIKLLEKDIPGARKVNFKNNELKSSLLRFKRNAEGHLNRFFTSSVFLGAVYGLALNDKVILQFSRDPLFLFKKKRRIPAEMIRRNRKDLGIKYLEFGAKDNFEKVIERIIIRHLPDNFFTTYKFDADTRPGINTWVGMDLCMSPEGCFEISAMLERGGRWISSQHGGAYGQLLSFPLGKMEYEISGGFISWGWTHKHVYDSKYYPLPSPMLSKLRKHREEEDSAIFMGTMVPSYIYRLDNYLSPEEILSYLKNKTVFLDNLDKEVLNKIKYRPYTYNYSTGEIELIEKSLPGDRLLTSGRITDHFSRTRLAVIDHPSTGYLEALAMNTPTVLFWDPSQFVSCEGIVPLFNRLRDAGILFDRPEAAAKKVNEIWPDVKSWWNRPEIQSAKDDFCRQYARSSPAWRSEWAKFLKGL